jgi:energy-coupling factor transporter ATP-binding protein EcfA2
MLKIKPFKTNKSNIKLRPLMKDCTIPKFPQSLLMVGASASGKTTLLQNLMLNKDMYKGFHDFVFLFSITAKLDDSLKKLKVKKSHIFDTEEEMIENLKTIFDAQKENVEKHGVDKSPKIILIFEDLTTNKKLMNDKIFASLWTLGRHLNMQVVALIHKYKALPRTQRLNAMNIIYFAGSSDETQQLVDDFTPPNHSKKEFTEIVNFATREPHSFLYICNKLPFVIKFRKNFDTILKLKK